MNLKNEGVGGGKQFAQLAGAREGTRLPPVWPGLVDA